MRNCVPDGYDFYHRGSGVRRRDFVQQTADLGRAVALVVVTAHILGRASGDRGTQFG